MPIASAISGIVMPGRALDELERLLAALAAALRAPAPALRGAGARRAALRRGARGAARARRGLTALRADALRARRRPPRAGANSSTSGRSSFRRASISRRFSSTKSAMAHDTFRMGGQMRESHIAHDESDDSITHSCAATPIPRSEVTRHALLAQRLEALERALSPRPAGCRRRPRAGRRARAARAAARNSLR